MRATTGRVRVTVTVIRVTVTVIHGYHVGIKKNDSGEGEMNAASYVRTAFVAATIALFAAAGASAEEVLRLAGWKG